MKLRIKSSLNPAIVRGTRNDTIVAGTIYEVNGQKWTHTYLQLTGHISYAAIEWAHPALPKAVKVETKQVRGSTGKTYTLTRQPSGKWLCTCPGFKYRRFCKHTGAK